MPLLLIVAFISGLVTIAAPCIWPLLPIVLSASGLGTRLRAIGVALGIVTSFGVLTLTLSSLLSVVPFDPDALRLVAVIIILIMGTTMLVPQFGAILEAAMSRLSAKSSGLTRGNNAGFGGGYVTGLALGVVWTPCAGPILGTIAALSSTQQVSFGLVTIMLAYMAGVAIPLALFALGGNWVVKRARLANKYTGAIQQVFGAIMILTAVLIFTNADKALQVKLLDAFPSYSNFIADLESAGGAREELNKLKGDNAGTLRVQEGGALRVGDQELPRYGAAPEFDGIEKWLNTPQGQALTMREDLRGKVVLIDFWTYTCINCIRTLPHVTGWYEKYKDQGFVVVGVHTPEFEFEKKTDNVLDAMAKYNINYPVAQDNDFVTWQAYSNQYWPAKYLIDAQGQVRYAHFGEGKYEETEEAIKKLLSEAGEKTDNSFVEAQVSGGTPGQTPETYLGAWRIDRFVSTEPFEQDIEKSYTLPTSLTRHSFGYGGTWKGGYQDSRAGANAALKMQFFSKEVYLVMKPAEGSSGQVRVLLDGEPVKTSAAGDDVDGGVAAVDTDRIYHLISLPEAGEHTLELQFDSGIDIFAFTFG